MTRGFAARRGATAASSRSRPDIAARVHLSSTSMAFSHSITMVIAGSVEDAFAGGDRLAGALLEATGFAAAFFAGARLVGVLVDVFAMGRHISRGFHPCQPDWQQQLNSSRLRVRFRLKSLRPSTIYSACTGQSAPRKGETMANWQ